jgi:hypothetical protein
MPTDLEDVIARVREEKLTYLSERCLGDLARAVTDADAHRRPGLIIEAGTALGGSAIVMACAKSRSRRMKVYDAFSMIPPPSDLDGDDVHRRYAKIASGKASGIGGETYYGYREDLLGEVTNSFKEFDIELREANVELIKGYFDETLHIDEPVALAHLDSDWYESTLTCLQRIEPNLVPGGRLVIDDYFKWSGCRRAIDEYFDGRPGYEFERHGRLHIVKTARRGRWFRWWRVSGQR